MDPSSHSDWFRDVPITEKAPNVPIGPQKGPMRDFSGTSARTGRIEALSFHLDHYVNERKF